MTLAVPANETGLLRVFALSMSPEEAKALKANTGDPMPQAAALGLDTLDPDHVEVFPISDLGEMTLPEYLVEGPGATQASIAPDTARLGSLDGWVMVVYSRAFGGEETTLTPVPALTLIGTYPQQGVDWSAPLDLSTPSALPTPRDVPTKRPSDAAMSGRVAMVALLVALALVGLMVWVAG